MICWKVAWSAREKSACMKIWREGGGKKKTESFDMNTVRYNILL